ncbi:coiled-coil domain-containing protein 114 [Larimichthys crocea]|uniref:Uncharacterized protein n=1 Tax=Larimichthys crocea TaxID=215358 RepID=A0ACD3RE34_LARCR|nr:coiled-coil domain-containing protein 114 [Larimichthys crocea]TMS16913.1 Coiled-coil domain-containing protein 114 [Larimichthys crocea]
MSRRSVRSQILWDCSEADLIKLQQQYRREEGAYRAYTTKTQALFNRDEHEIQRLLDEREVLLSSFGVSQSSFTSGTDPVVQDLSAMLTCKDKIDEELKAEEAQIASLKDQISKWERKLVGQKTGGATTRPSLQSDDSKLLKSTRLIENKLHMGRECFNKLMARNGELREELKTLQLEKKHFLQIQSQLEMELHANRKDICNLMTTCTETFNVREKIKEKRKMLEDQNAKDTAHYIKESSDLERELCHQSCVQGFLNIKTIGCNNLNSGCRKVEKGKTLESNELGLEDFEDVINKTLRETGDSDLDKLIRNFIQREEQNYTLLNFVNYQHSETEVIRKHITQLCSERETFLAEEQQQLEQHQVLRTKVSIKQEATEQKLAVTQYCVDFMEKLLDQLKEGVKSLLQICYGSLVTCDQLDSSDRDQDENIKAYLRMVEDQVNELLALQSYLHLQERPSEWDIDSLSTIAGQLLGISPPPADLTIAAAIPAPVKRDEADLVASVLLEAKEPVSREGLRTLANKRVQRKKTPE